MAHDTLKSARSLMRRRKFSAAITLLESRRDFYENNFDYYLMLGTACLYVGDPGSASTYYQQARKIKLTDTTLLLGQAALFLRRGDTDRALQYYLDIIDYDPENKIARSAMEFIRTRGDYGTICRWVDNGKIEQFYPPLGLNPGRVFEILLPAAACVLGCLLVIRITAARKIPVAGPRADLSSFVLSVDEAKHAQEADLAGSTYHYILTNRQITDSYAAAQKYFQEYRDNAAQVELNRLLSSNASVAIKQKAHLLMGYLSEPTFDTLTDNPTYKQVADDPLLYLDCWVAWDGRVSNAVMDGTAYQCDLLVGYETMEKVDGIVPLHFATAPDIDSAKPVKVLAKITSDDGKIKLEGRSVYQSVKDSLEKP